MGADGPAAPATPARYGPSLVLFEILGRDIILRNLPGPDFGCFRLKSPLNPIDDARLEGLPFVDKFLDALRVRFRNIGESLIIAGMVPRSQSNALRLALVLPHALDDARDRPLQVDIGRTHRSRLSESRADSRL